MRVTFVLGGANLSGGVRVVCIYASLLAKRGHRVTIVAQRPRARGWKERLRRALRGEWPARVPAPPPSHLDALGTGPVELRWMAAEADEAQDLASIPDADLIVATWWETVHRIMPLPPEKGRKVSFMQDYGAPGQPLEELVRTWDLGLPMVTVSGFLARLVDAHSPQEFDVIPNAVDHGLFHAPERGKQRVPTVGFLYSRNPQKGTRLCIDAIEHARLQVPELRVLAFGPDEPTEEVPLPSAIRYASRVPEVALRDIYSACDAWLFGTHKEGFGLPILEAMACRTPVIATPAGAAPELIASGGGALVPHNDPAAMAREIVRLARLSEPDWRRMSNAAHATTTDWTWADAAERFEAFLQRQLTTATP